MEDEKVKAVASKRETTQMSPFSLKTGVKKNRYW